jgi:hypothetical protein
VNLTSMRWDEMPLVCSRSAPRPLPHSSILPNVWELDSPEHKQTQTNQLGLLVAQTPTPSELMSFGSGS